MLLLRKAHPATRTMIGGDPTPEQAMAGDYPKLRREWRGLTVAIEHPEGTVREGVDETGKPWRTVFRYAYGEILGTLGMDSDPVDVFIGSYPDAPEVYIVQQMKRKQWDVADEQKVMIDFAGIDEARQAYLEHYDDPRFFGGITAMPVDEFVAKVRATATNKKPAMIKAIFLKAHVDAYTKKDGTFVAAHEDKRKKHVEVKSDQLYRMLADAEDSGGSAAVHAKAREILAAQPDLSSAIRSAYSDLGVSAPEWLGSPDSKPTLSHSEPVGVKKSTDWDASKSGEEIARYMDDDEDYADFGLRIIPSGHDVKAGDVLPVSKRWDDGEDTGEELDGTSTIGIGSKDSIDRAISDLMRGGYQGAQVALVKGERKGSGEDPGEAIIKDATVVATWKLPEMTKSSAPLALFFKGFIGPYLRGGKIVNARGYQGRSARAQASAGQMSLFGAGEPQHTEPTRELIEEHERLVDVLNSPSHEDDKVEAKKQAEELAGYKEEAAAAKEPTKAQQTRARRKAVLDVLGEGWKADAGVDGAKDRYSKVFSKEDGGKLDVTIMPEKTVDGNFYVGSYHRGGKRRGAGSNGYAQTVEEAKAMAERFAGVGQTMTKSIVFLRQPS